MNTFANLNLSKSLLHAIEDLGFHQPTPIQSAAYSIILSGKNIVGIAQTGTGKTLAYMLPLLKGHKYSKQIPPKILILVPTRELVIQVMQQITAYAKYMQVRVMGVYGGTNITTQKNTLAQGMDILVATPGRLYDLALAKAIKLRDIKQVVIDEVDVMLDLGFKFQLTNIFDLMPQQRQNIMFSATMTEQVEELIDTYFIAPVKISIALSGARLENIEQRSFHATNFYSKANLLKHILKDHKEFNKVLIFVSGKKNVELLYEALESDFGSSIGIIHTDRSQNNRIAAIKNFESGATRILISTDVMARGLDLDTISHVISFDTPNYPENYIHRIGRAGRAARHGKSLLLFTDKETTAKAAIEALMDYKIIESDWPAEVQVSKELTSDERPRDPDNKNPLRNEGKRLLAPGFHEKKEKNKKVNLGGSYKFEVARKYKKPKTRGDKIKNKKRSR